MRPLSGKSPDETWREKWDTTDNRGEVFPTPGDWWLDDSVAAAVDWHYDPPRHDDGSINYAAHTWDTTQAILRGDFGEPIETLEFEIDHETVFTVDIEERGEGRSCPWTRIEPVFAAVATALHEYHVGGDWDLVECESLIGHESAKLTEFGDDNDE